VRRAPGSRDARQGAALAADVEGYLRAQTDLAEARRAAEAFCARLPWLTSAQAEDVARHFADEHIGMTREMLTRTVRRAAELRGEYQARYDQLRRRLLVRHTLAMCALLAAWVPAVLLLSR
jgi:hypothetical protein